MRVAAHRRRRGLLPRDVRQQPEVFAYQPLVAAQHSFRFVHEQSIAIAHSNREGMSRHRARHWGMHGLPPEAAPHKAFRSGTQYRRGMFSTIPVDRSVHIL